MNDLLLTGFEIVAGMIVVPWCVFVTASIFSLKQSHALMKMEMGLMREIKDWLLLQKRERT